MRRLVPARVECQALIVGEVASLGEGLRGRLRLLSVELELNDRVIWAGHRDDIPAMLRLCDLFALPSEQPFGRAIVEAMACGLPVVACNRGGVPEIVMHGLTRLLVEPHNPGSSRRRSISCWLLPKPPGRWGRGRQRAVEQFDIQRVARQVEELYRRII